MDTASHLSFMRRFFSGTLLSRLSGMGRDLAMAFAFGDHVSVAAFMVAFRLSNLFRRLLGEGPLQSVLIPHFEDLRAKDEKNSSHFFRKLSFLLLILLIGVTIFSESVILACLNFFSFSPDNREILELTAWMLPGLIFICLYGINISALQCHHSFFLPSVAPFVCNSLWIAGALYYKNSNPSLAMVGLAKLVALGFFCQWLLTLPLTVKKISGNIREWLGHTLLLSPEIKQLFKAFGLGMVVVGASQINGFLDALFARYADLKGPVYLWYSIRLEQLALAVFGMACVSTIVPSLSRAISAGNQDEAQKIFSVCYGRILTIMIPCTGALVFLGASGIDLIYGHGHFSSAAVAQTTLCLWAYGIGLLPSTLVLLFFAVLYAKKEFRKAMQIALGAILIHLALNSLFVFALGWGAISTALATSISSWVQALALGRLLSKEGWAFAAPSLWPVVSATAIACAAVFSLDFSCFHHTILSLFFGAAIDLPLDLKGQLFLFASESLLFVAALFLCAAVFRYSLKSVRVNN